MTTKAHLLKNTAQSETAPRKKVTIVGSGSVGIAIAFSIIARGISKEVIIVARDKDKVSGEIRDMQQGSCFLNNAKITGGDDVACTTGSNLIIFTAGRRQFRNQLDSLQQNIEVLKKLISALVERSPECILIIVSSPCDILTHVAWKISGLPPHRVLGSGTHLDSSRFRQLIAERFGVDATAIQSWIIGEQGEPSFPAWSNVTIAGTKLREINPNAGLENDRENWAELHAEVINNVSDATDLKGYTSWGIALSCSDLVSSIVNDTNEVKAVSTMAKGLYGIDKDIFLSLPCVLNNSGVSSVVNISLNDEEKKKLRTSADFIEEVLNTFSF